MIVHDVTYRMSLLGGVSHDWKIERNQYTVPDGQLPLLIKAPLTSDFEWGFGDVTAQYIVTWRYILGDAGWSLIARETNFDSNWGPKMTVFT